MRIINKGASELEIVDPAFKVVEGEPIPDSAKIQIGIGDDIPVALWKALPLEKQEFYKKIGAVEVTEDMKKDPEAAPGKSNKLPPAA